jgi:hypothetical protein
MTRDGEFAVKSPRISPLTRHSEPGGRVFMRVFARVEGL